MGQPKMKYWKLHELHKNEVKNVHPYEHMPKNLEVFNFEHLPKHSISKLGGGIQFFGVGLDHSGSQLFNYKAFHQWCHRIKPFTPLDN